MTKEFYMPDRSLTVGDDYYDPSEKKTDSIFDNVPVKVNNDLDTPIQYYNQNVDCNGDYYFNSSHSGSTTIQMLLDGIRNPKPEVRKLIDRIRTETDKTKRSELKSRLTGFIIQSYGTGLKRDYQNITSFTGFTVLDFDGNKVKGYAEELKQFLFDTYNFIVASYISPSGAVKCIMRVEIAQTIKEYQDYYRAIEDYFKNFDGFDATPKNAVLIMYYTYDPDILIRTDATVWSKKMKDKPKLPAPAPASVEVLENADLNIRRAYGLIGGLLNKISDNGHPQLRSATKILGGYVAQYNLSLSEVEQWIYSKIESHPYLSKGIAGYKKTAKQFIDNGFNEPVAFPE